MARGKKKVTEYKMSPEDPNKISFDLDSVLTMASVGYVIRTAIEEKAIEISSVKKCIPKSDVVKAIKQLGLGAWLDK